ncbi:MAG TPA: hypothetical protein VFF19_11065 [Reyranella sp.]|nr:hypothetical protein [Reyranella sp.]
MKHTAIAFAAAAALSLPGLATAQGKDIKIAMLLPTSAVFAVYGEAVMALISRGAVVAEGASATIRADQPLLNHYLGV